MCTRTLSARRRLPRSIDVRTRLSRLARPTGSVRRATIQRNTRASPSSCPTNTSTTSMTMRSACPCAHSGFAWSTGAHSMLIRRELCPDRVAGVSSGTLARQWEDRSPPSPSGPAPHGTPPPPRPLPPLPLRSPRPAAARLPRVRVGERPVTTKGGGRMTDDDCHHDESPMVLRHRRRWRGRLVIGVICGVVAMLATSTGLYLPVVRQLAWRKHVHIINHDRTVEDGGAVWIIETSTMRVLTTVTAYAYPSASLAARHREQSRTVLEGGETRIDAKNRARRVTWEWREEAFVPAWFTVHGHHPSPYWHEYPGGMYLIDSSAVGWPLRAFRWEETFGVVGNAVLTDDESSEFGFRGMLGLTQQVGVPALPIWPGLLLNTLAPHGTPPPPRPLPPLPLRSPRPAAARLPRVRVGSDAAGATGGCADSSARRAAPSVAGGRASLRARPPDHRHTDA